jgi:hypothetical protein
MDDDILAIVMNYKGEGFNEKFENLVIDFKKSIPEREKYLQNLNMQIDEKLKDLKKIEERFRGLKNFEFSLDNLKRDILKITDTAASIVDVSQIVAAAPAPGLKNEIQKSIRKKCIS